MPEVGETFARTPAAALVRRAPVTIASDAPLGEALALLRREDAGCLVVVAGERMDGILTDRDVVEHCFAPEVDLGAPVRVFMRRDPPTIGPEDSVETALAILDRRRVRYVPIVDAAGRAQGVVSVRAIIDFLAESVPMLILNQPPEPTRPLARREGG